MSRWTGQLHNHPINTTLQEVSTLLNIERENITPDEQIEKRRLLKVVALYQDAIQQVDAEIVPYQLIDDLNTKFRRQS